MPLLRLLLALALTIAGALPGVAWARGWQGVTPGATTEGEVAARFGPPSTQGKLSGRTALVYKGEQANGKPSQKAFTDDFRTVWMFKPSGITVYFGKEGTVDAISFKAPEAGKTEAARSGRGPAAGGEGAALHGGAGARSAPQGPAEQGWGPGGSADGAGPQAPSR